MRTLSEVNADIEEARSSHADFETTIIPLVEERSIIINHDRDEYEDKNFAVEIDCPIHITHKAVLFTRGHRYAGIWECDETDDGFSDVCPHYDIDIERDEDSEGNKVAEYVCAKCGVHVEGDPIADEREYGDE